MKIPNKLPGNLSIRAGDSSLFLNTGLSYNYAIGGIPFLSAASDTSYGHWWIKRETAPFRKEQFDNAQNPGEQSLQGYWLRSVMSFHAGAGQLYADPVEGTTSSDIRYWASKNVDVWTPGTLRLLPATFVGGFTDPPAPLDLLSVFYTNISGDTSAGYIAVSATAVYQYAVDFDDSHNQVWGGSSIISACTDGSNVYLHTTVGLYKGPVPTSDSFSIVFTKIYNYTATTGKVGWVKDRIVLGSDLSIYELVPSPPGPPAALPTALYTAKASGWTWTGITETTAAIYAVGSAINVSNIFKFTLDTSGDLPTLSGGTIACQLPGGETALSIFGYLGTFLAIGTSRGARVAVADDTGNLTYGPLLWDTGTPVYAFAARDHWIWATYKDPDDAEIKVARIDLSLQIEPLRFAWATDLSTTPRNGTDATDCKRLVFCGNSDVLAFGTETTTWIEDSFGGLQSDGWLETSRIRFNTLEPKIFRSIRVRGPQLEGSLNVAYVSSTGSITPVYTYGIGQIPGEEDLKLTATARDYLSFRFTLSSEPVDHEAGAEMFGWQVKALPGSPRQRMITLPLYCFDYEEDKHGLKGGGQGTAYARMIALENLEAQGNVTTYQDLDNNTAQDVYIENIEFQQGSPPTNFRQPGSFGGRILLTMRTV